MKHWYPETRFNCDNVRLPLLDEQCCTEFSDNQEIEVKAVREPHPSFGWIKAVVKMINGNPPSHFVVQYLNSSVTEIVSPDRVRYVNNNSHINGDTFYKFDIDVPEDVREFAKIDGIHKDLQKAIGASLVLYNPDQSVLSVISRSLLPSKRTLMLADVHFRNLKQKVMLLKKTEDLARCTAKPTTNGTLRTPYQCSDMATAINRPQPRHVTTSHQQHCFMPTPTSCTTMEDLKVEVLFENGVYYEGFVTGVMENEVLVSFPN
ncbi:synaptic functional regulator FMR1 isoform X2, partial [Aphis craccivora]